MCEHTCACAYSPNSANKHTHMQRNRKAEVFLHTREMLVNGFQSHNTTGTQKALNINLHNNKPNKHITETSLTLSHKITQNTSNTSKQPFTFFICLVSDGDSVIADGDGLHIEHVGLHTLMLRGTHQAAIVGKHVHTCPVHHHEVSAQPSHVLICSCECTERGGIGGRRSGGNCV